MPKDGLPVGARLESLEREVEELRRELRAATDRGNAQRSSVVRTRRLEIVDDQGRVHATLDADRSGAVLEILGPDGPRVRVSAPEGRGPAVVLFGDDGAPRVSLHAESVGHWEVAEGGEETHAPWAMLVASTARGIGPGLAVWDPAGRPRAALVVTDDGPGLYLSGDGEDPAKDALVLQVTGDGPSAAFHDGGTIPRIGLGVRPEMGPFLTFLDAAGNARIVAQEEGDRASIELFDGNEAPSLLLVSAAAGGFSQLVVFGAGGEAALAAGVYGTEAGFEVFREQSTASGGGAG